MAFYVQIWVIVGEKVVFKNFYCKEYFVYFEHRGTSGGTLSSLFENVGIHKIQEVKS